MNFFIIDDDDAIRYMLSDIIEDNDLGTVVGESKSGSSITPSILEIKKVDIVLIDLLMPFKDGLQVIEELKNSFSGKFIMISQLEDKDTIGRAYSLGVQYYITKPINSLEVVGVIKNVIENIRLEKSIYKIQDTLNFLKNTTNHTKNYTNSNKNIITCSEFILSELGILSENGSTDIISIMKYLYLNSKNGSLENNFPRLKTIFISISKEKLSKTNSNYTNETLQKEVKASEQRIRRSISQAINHVASIGLIDYSSPKFEDYAAEFFEFEAVRKRMLELKNGSNFSKSSIHINIKKFIKAFYIKLMRML
ncbi:response regulator [Clostridium sp. cel8]|uniref:response regulator n=1 Tax=Clostridium sp. cel8 TaxID=2663123 RepID=UPI0015F3AD86|nr:response regulator [Clostridium sp. cel8]MBA5852024.1 response regulator [Clostridium sp. cel8]